MLSHPGDPLPRPSAPPSLRHSRGKADKGDIAKGERLPGTHQDLPHVPLSHDSPAPLGAKGCSAPSVGCGTGDELPPPKPCSEIVSELPSLQLSLRARCSPSFPGAGAIPSLLPLPSPGALPRYLNQGRNKSTPWLPKSSYLCCHQETALELTSILWSVLPLSPGSQEAPLSPGRSPSLWGQMEAHRLGTGNHSPCWQCWADIP